MADAVELAFEGIDRLTDKYWETGYDKFGQLRKKQTSPRKGASGRDDDPKHGKGSRSDSRQNSTERDYVTDERKGGSRSRDNDRRRSQDDDRRSPPEDRLDRRASREAYGMDPEDPNGRRNHGRRERDSDRRDHCRSSDRSSHGHRSRSHHGSESRRSSNRDGYPSSRRHRSSSHGQRSSRDGNRSSRDAQRSSRDAYESGRSHRHSSSRDDHHSTSRPSRNVDAPSRPERAVAGSTSDDPRSPPLRQTTSREQPGSVYPSPPRVPGPAYASPPANHLAGIGSSPAAIGAYPTPPRGTSTVYQSAPMTSPMPVHAPVATTMALRPAPPGRPMPPGLPRSMREPVGGSAGLRTPGPVTRMPARARSRVSGPDGKEDEDEEHINKLGHLYSNEV